MLKQKLTKGTMKFDKLPKRISLSFIEPTEEEQAEEEVEGSSNIIKEMSMSAIQVE